MKQYPRNRFFILITAGSFTLLTLLIGVFMLMLPTPSIATAASNRLSVDASPAFAPSNVFTVEVSDFQFSPQNLVISAGDTVVWVRKDGFHNVAATDGSFRLGDELGNPNNTWTSVSRTFTETGTIDYLCEEHPMMTGSIEIQASEPSMTATAIMTEPVTTPTAIITRTVTPVTTPIITPSITVTTTPVMTMTATPVPEPSATATDISVPTVPTVPVLPSATATPVPSTFAKEDIVITEVFYHGAADNPAGAVDWIELQNLGSDTIDISAWWFCATFDYEELSNLTILMGDDLILAPGEVIVFQAWTDLKTESDLALYIDDNGASPSFSDADYMVDFLQWGSATVGGRGSVAVTKGIWPETGVGQFDFVPGVALNETIVLISSNTGLSATDFAAGLPTQGQTSLPTTFVYLPFVAPEE